MCCCVGGGGVPGTQVTLVWLRNQGAIAVNSPKHVNKQMGQHKKQQLQSGPLSHWTAVLSPAAAVIWGSLLSAASLEALFTSSAVYLAVSKLPSPTAQVGGSCQVFETQAVFSGSCEIYPFLHISSGE